MSTDVERIAAEAARRRTSAIISGPLQFEVLQYRLQGEYGAESRLGARH